MIADTEKKHYGKFEKINRNTFFSSAKPVDVDSTGSVTEGCYDLAASRSFWMSRFLT